MVASILDGRFDTSNQGTSLAGRIVPLSRAWPRTDPAALPTCQRSLHDTDGDRVADVVLTTRVRLVDQDGNGMADGVWLHVIGAEPLRPDVELECGERQRREAVNRAIDCL